jgi:hypothetical protein
VKDNYKVILGDDIIKYYEPYTEEQKTVATKQNGEPMAFSLSGASAPVTSEQFTLYNLTPEELSSKGVGGRRQMYNYVSANQDVIMIQTPPDNYRPDKVSNNITVETIQSQRNEELPKGGIPPIL